MNTALWVVQGLLAVAFLMTGSMKLFREKAKLKEAGMAWTDDYSPTQIRLIGLAELLGAVGVIVPWWTGILPILTPIAAGCLVVIMLGAIAAHARRREPPMIVPGAVLVALAAFVAWGRR